MRRTHWRRWALAAAGAICTTVATLAAIPSAAEFVSDSWCWATNCQSNVASPSNEVMARPVEGANVKSRDANDICQFDYLIFRSDADRILGGQVRENNGVFRVFITSCDPATGEFGVRRDPYADLSHNDRSSSFYNGVLRFSLRFTAYASSVECSFESAERKSFRLFTGQFSCTRGRIRMDPTGSHPSEIPGSEILASSGPETISVTLYE